MTIVRGTVPAELFGHRDYGALLGRLALPQFVMQAIAPFALALLFLVDPARVAIARMRSSCWAVRDRRLRRRPFGARKQPLMLVRHAVIVAARSAGEPRPSRRSPASEPSAWRSTSVSGTCSPSLSGRAN